MAIGPPFIQVNGYTTVGDPITGPRNTYENAYDYSGFVELGARAARTQVRRRLPALACQRTAGHCDQRLLCVRAVSRCPRMRSPAFLFGQPVFFLQGRGDFSRGIRGNSLNGYAQDTYKVTSRLTLNLGLRYELPFPYTEIHNRQTLFIPGRQSTVMPNAPAGLLYPGDRRRSRRA